MIAVMQSGVCISIIPGEGLDEDCFAGELLHPSARDARLNLHLSSMWDRSRVVRVRPCLPDEPDYGGDDGLSRQAARQSRGGEG